MKKPSYLYLLIYCLVSHGLLAQTKSAIKKSDSEKYFLSNVNDKRFKVHLKKLTERPHVAGSIENEQVRDYITMIMNKAGFEVTQYPYDIYLSNKPGSSELSIVRPQRIPLNQKEDILNEDPFSSDPLLWKGWNAYSGNGDATSEIVYVNYGRKEDFEMLKELGVSIKGKIVLARYGGNFRGYKAKFAEAHGASGLIIYTDPKDSGFTKGLVYPEGPYYNSSTIQRGSLLTEDFTGDPLTPFEPALPIDGKVKIKRLNPKDTKLHKIPVTPIGYGEAEKIIGQMKGDPVPLSWQGGLPFTYRVQGGDQLIVNLKVDQPKKIVRVYNVVGKLKGSTFPDEWIILGCHYDAWGFGATDPNSGTAMLLSLSETLGEMVKAGFRPKRSILIGHWDAEEHGVIGSAEWVEQMQETLKSNAIAYMNFDGGVSGKNFSTSSAPSLKKLAIDASKKVDHPYKNKSLYDVWNKTNTSEPPIGNLGGGSDHIAFYMHAGIPSLSGGTGGANLYHSNYDSFEFYKRFVDPEFKMGAMIEQWSGLMALKLSNSDVIPYDLNRYASDLKKHFSDAEAKIKTYNSDFSGFKLSNASISKLDNVSKIWSKRISIIKQLKIEKLKNINKQLIGLEKSFIDKKGMYFGSWYKSLYAATDPFSGYASWILPGIEYEIALKRSSKLKEWDLRYSKAINNLSIKIVKLTDSLP
ncbi:MAG: M28 family peptidase [Flavobacteriaceae bacterium]|nr:M28 family peptidase [Flavobacteriaceae bacterium]